MGAQKLAECLGLNALPFHINTILVSVIFYYAIYMHIGPWFLKKRAPFKYASMPKDRRLLWDAWAMSVSQSFIHSSLAVYIILFQETLPQTPQERILGYSPQVQSVVSLGAGYMAVHLCQTIKDRHISGYLMVLHSVFAFIIMSLGFRPFAIFYTRWFLIWELPNLFLNFQRWMDMTGMRSSHLRALNRAILLVTFFITRVTTGVYGTYRMAADIFIVVQDPHPMVREALLLPTSSCNNISSLGLLCEVPRMNTGLAYLQLISMIGVNAQALYWFFVIVVRKSENNPNFIQSAGQKN